MMQCLRLYSPQDETPSEKKDHTSSLVIPVPVNPTSVFQLKIQMGAQHAWSQLNISLKYRES